MWDIWCISPRWCSSNKEMMGKLGSRDPFSSREAGQERDIQRERGQAHPCDCSRGDAETAQVLVTLNRA